MATNTFIMVSVMPITLVLGGGILAILIEPFLYPLYYLWGAEKTEVILIISVIGLIGMLFALTMLVNTFSGMEMFQILCTIYQLIGCHGNHQYNYFYILLCLTKQIFQTLRILN